jgi:hypothetical protein
LNGYEFDWRDKTLLRRAARTQVDVKGLQRAFHANRRVIDIKPDINYALSD